MTPATRVVIRYAAVGLCLAVAAWTARPARGREPRAPGLNQLVVIHPGAHERGLPAVRLKPTVDGSVQVDIPRTVHVHRYYYDGDKEYQGPILQGGPTVVVANHPKWGQQMYVDVTLPAGAPIIAYDRNSITYVYPDRRVELQFSRWRAERVAVKYHAGQGVGRRASEVARRIVANSRDTCDGSPTLQSVKELATGGGGVVLGAVEGVDTLVGALIRRVTAVGELVPGVQPLFSSAEERPQRVYQHTIRRAQVEKNRAELKFLPTIR